jgi:transposase
LRRSRSIGLAKTHAQHVITATAINLSRLLAWLMGIPLDGTRVSRFAALAA